MKPLELPNAWPIEIAQPNNSMLPVIKFELLQHLKQLAEHDQPHVIDLTSLPLSANDRQSLESFLGRGEVAVTLSTLGESQIIETRYSGIWWIKHFGAEGQLLSEFIEITRIPEIIQSHTDDIRQSINSLTGTQTETDIEKQDQ